MQQQALLHQRLLQQQQQLMAIQQQPHLSDMEKSQLIHKLMQVIYDQKSKKKEFIETFSLNFFVNSSSQSCLRNNNKLQLRHLNQVIQKEFFKDVRIHFQIQF